jgi:hypothetical protein
MLTHYVLRIRRASVAAVVDDRLVQDVLELAIGIAINRTWAEYYRLLGPQAVSVGEFVNRRVGVNSLTIRQRLFQALGLRQDVGGTFEILYRYEAIDFRLIEVGLGALRGSSSVLDLDFPDFDDRASIINRCFRLQTLSASTTFSNRISESR